MNQRLQSSILLTSSTTTSATGETFLSYTPSPTPVYCILCAPNGSTAVSNEILNISSTHTALTQDTRPKASDRLCIAGTYYTILYITEGARYRQLALRAEEALLGHVPKPPRSLASTPEALA